MPSAERPGSHLPAHQSRQTRAPTNHLPWARSGESVGHYEGDELVVDTIGVNEKTFVDNYRTPHTDKMHVVERFKLLDGGKTLQDRITVDDPGALQHGLVGGAALEPHQSRADRRDQLRREQLRISRL